MLSGATALMACLATIVAGLAVTQHPELRCHRWLKIALSIPIVLLIVSAFQELGPVRGYFAMFGLGVLAFVWKGPMGHFLSFLFVRLLVGDWQRPTGVQVELGGVRALKKHREFSEALALLTQELDKDPLDHEGLLLLGELLEALQQPAAAAKALQKLLNKPGLSADQRSMVSARLRRVEERQLIGSLNQR
jgi:hypothetical protein